MTTPRAPRDGEQEACTSAQDAAAPSLLGAAGLGSTRVPPPESPGGGRQPVPAADRGVAAASVMPLRDGAGGVEVLLLQRHADLAFAGGAWVFPGGRVDPADETPDAAEQDVARRAAVREAAEEAALALPPSALVPVAHWTPPSGPGRRFATWIFAAAAGSADVVVDGGEIVGHEWVRPADALERRDAGELELMPPTWVCLWEAAQHGSVDEALRHFASRPPASYTTRLAQVDGAVVCLWSGDAGYASGDPARPGARHRLTLGAARWDFQRTGAALP